MKIFFGDEDDEYSYEDENISYLYDEELSMIQGSSDCSSLSSSSRSFGEKCELSPTSPHGRPRESLRKKLSHVFASPNKGARRTIGRSGDDAKISPSRNPRKKLMSFKSPRKNKGAKEEEKTWQEKFDLPPNTTRDQAMVLLLYRELEMMDL